MSIHTNDFLVNSNPNYKNTELLNEFIEPHIFINRLIRHRNELILSSEEIEIDARFDYRPDRLAGLYYNQDFWFPAILVANGLGSILQFKAETLNHKCLIPSAIIIQQLMNLSQVPPISVENTVDILFK